MRVIQYSGLIGLWLTGWLSAQAFNADNRSIFSDIKAHRIGDIVTVVIVENTNASSESKTNQSGAANMGMTGNVTGTLTDYLPLFGVTGGLNSAHDGKQGAEQKERMTGKISATIVEQTEAGTFKIKGERIMEVNGEKNLIQIEGLVRPRDIGTDNIVYSYNVADARVIYRKSGLKGKMVKPGSVQRIGSWVLGIGLLAVAITGGIK